MQRVGFSLKFVCLPFMLLSFLAGCATTGGGASGEAKLAPEELVAKRAEERWGLLIKGDFDRAYEYLSPAYRTSTPLSLYKAPLKAGLWQRAQVMGVECEQAKSICVAKVKVTISYHHRYGVFTNDSVLAETWFIADGQWWFTQEK